jgi:hypothetical protein
MQRPHDPSGNKATTQNGNSGTKVAKKSQISFPREIQGFHLPSKDPYHFDDARRKTPMHGFACMVQSARE